MGFGPEPSTPTEVTIREHRDWWSDVNAKITIAAAADDLDFPDVVISGLPSGATIVRVVAMLKYSHRQDDSGADNYIDEASKAIRVKKSTGSWGTDDVVAIDIPQNSLYTTASAKEGGDLIVGDNDVKSEVDGDATYNFRSEETERGDAISALADYLYLYDVQMGIRVEFTV
jgi:hypothetical protein